MSRLRKNIWGLFFILFLSSLIYFINYQYTKWKNLHDDYDNRQKGLVNLVADASNSLFLTQEMMLEVVGSEAYKNKSHLILDNILKINPSFVAFGFVSSEGKPLYFSSNLNKNKMPNLKTNPKTRDSFLYSISKDKMVIGRTYFMKAYDEWGIPVRKTIFNEDGSLAGLITAGLRLKGSAKLFDVPLHWGDSHEVMLIRDFDNYIQYYSGNKKDFKEIYNSPIDKLWMNTLFKEIEREYKLSLDEIKESEKTFNVTTTFLGEDKKEIALKYDKYFEFWIVSTFLDEEIHNEFRKTLFVDLLVFFLLLAIIFTLFQYIAQAEKKKEEALIFQATHDVLTKLPNRNYLERYIDEWIYEKAPPFSIFYLDLDRFKNVNDSFGHKFGDYVLIELSRRVEEIIDDKSIFIRQGGDEFIILTRESNEAVLTSLAQYLIQIISKPYMVDHFSFVIGVSIGIAKYPDHGKDLDMLLRASDIAMYEAKKHKNSVFHFTPAMQEKFLRSIDIEQALRKAIENEELYMVYQPQIDVNGKVYGVESLVRWNDSKRGMVTPDEFIVVAENYGLMPQLGQFILKTSLQEMEKLQQKLGRTYRISINISVKQFMEASFLQILKNEIDKTSLNTSDISLEITESLFIEDIDYLLPLLHEIHDMGISISMDDFGTGFSSLSMLSSLPIDELKVDRTFVIKMLEDETETPMIQNIIDIGKNLNLNVLAEGIETKEHTEKLKSFGCDRFQGFYYAKPMTYEKLEEFLREEDSK